MSAVILIITVIIKVMVTITITMTIVIIMIVMTTTAIIIIIAVITKINIFPKSFLQVPMNISNFYLSIFNLKFKIPSSGMKEMAWV